MTGATEIRLNYDPVVECSWLPDQEVRLSQYNQMITDFVQHYIAEKLDAKQIRFKEFTDGSQSAPEGM
jgi:hypothetical protein